MRYFEDGRTIQFDLHGLFIKEAIHKLNAFVLPILSELNKVVLTTGHGLQKIY